MISELVLSSFPMFCFVLLEGDTGKGTKRLSEELGDISVPLCPAPWTELLTPGAMGTKHRSPPEWRPRARAEEPSAS